MVVWHVHVAISQQYVVNCQLAFRYTAIATRASVELCHSSSW